MTQAVLHELAPGDIPEGGEVRVVQAPDGARLRVATFPARPGRAARGTVLVMNGYTEFIEKYYEVIARLQSRDFAVVTFDWRGQGLSSRLLSNRFKGHVEDYADFLSDALRIYEEFVAPRPRPHLLLGHSMGGHLALRFLEDFPGRFERAVLSAPMLGFDQFPLSLGRAVSSASCALGFGTSYTPVRGDPDPANPVNDVTTDQQRFSRAMAYLDKVPDLRLGGPTWRWFQQATSSISRIMDRERLIQVKTPVLVASAELDTIVSPDKHAPLPFLNTSFTVLPIEKAMHEILQETDETQERFWAAFDQFAA